MFNFFWNVYLKNGLVLCTIPSFVLSFSLVNSTDQSPSTSALFDAITNNGQKPFTSLTPTNNNNSVKLHTFQLVNPTNNTSQINKPITNQQQQQLTPSKTPTVQRIQSVNLNNCQSITKTIVNASANQQLPSVNSYKVSYCKLI